jgi:ElaB/YqjD/DUF883 family membrane-anchored ribosome-binding protein
LTTNVETAPNLVRKEMTTEEQISKNQDDRDEARQNLRDTLNEVNAKVERVGDELRPDHVIQSHPLAATLTAATVGFLIGTMVGNRTTRSLMIAAALAVVLAIRTEE